MGVDYAEKEREFIDALKADTGRDLVGWMEAIRAQNIAERNALIDWLRMQGFTFARASWMERIHHNGGRLIYADDVPPQKIEPLPPVAPAQPLAIRPVPVVREKVTSAIGNTGFAAPHDTAEMPPSEFSGELPALVADRPELEALFEMAKAYRALARHVTAEIEKLVPGSGLAVAAPVLTFSAPHDYAALLVGPKGVRLYLDVAFDVSATLKKADAAGARLRAPPYGQVALLTDARAVDADLKRAIISSAARARA